MTPMQKSALQGLAQVAPEVPVPVAHGAAASDPAPANEVVAALAEGWRYGVDFFQRNILFIDTLRERGSGMLAHAQADMPPLLDFDYETVLDARDFDTPANYALLHVTHCQDAHARDCTDESKPPVIIVDPRAGHGPGIGGFKRASEVGMALHEGYPTYFVMFFPKPCPGQTLVDVLRALHRFVEAVSARHGGKAPVLYGNCQAGWAVTLLAADCESLAGTTVLCGSPLSYWAGAADVNPMRLGAGLNGGTWLAHLAADLGDGMFDGAWLVQNFESLNPANTLWEKNYHLFANVDSERERFLAFERWWTGYYFLGRDEILAIVENLFIGNKLERGMMHICDCCYVDLKRIRHPLIIFASSGDNIAPPHQALNWIPTVYPTTDELKQAGQRIVYLLNKHVGHLGIFVSADVAKLEHRAILDSLADLEALPPGLYEMKIGDPTGDPDCRKPQYAVHFEERQVEQIRYAYPEKSFERVQAISEWNEFVYRNTLSPFVSALTTPASAALMRWWHPMRLGPLLYSEQLNPLMQPLASWAAAVRRQRMPVEPGNRFTAAEHAVSDTVQDMLDGYRKLRDHNSEQWFNCLYGTTVK